MWHLRHRMRLLFSLLLLLLGFGCQLPTSAPDLAEQTQAITEVFETPVAYSVRVLDSSAVEHFLNEHPEYRADSSEIRAFYQRRRYQFAWFVNDSLSQSAAAFFNLVNSADTSFRELGFIQQRLNELMMADAIPSDTLTCDSCLLRLELDFTAQFFRFAERNYSGTVGKDLRELDWFIPRRKKNYDRLLDSLVAGHMDLGLIEPVHPQYALLKAQLKRFHDLDTLPWPVITLGDQRKLEPGGAHEAVFEIRHRLLLLGDLDGLTDSLVLTSADYDSTLVKAVKRFQLRHGLHPDGVIGQSMLKHLNVPPSARLRTMLVNMERLRWVPERNAPDLLLVNIPEFRLHVYEADTVAWSMVVVVGATATRTVIFSDTLTRIAFSPTWTLPQSIVRGEILPAIAKDPDYLSKKNMEIIGGSEANPIIRQRPGASNALGRVKFLFPNSYDIYFHDTPSKRFFARESRAFSHGCIRLSEPQRFAEYLLRNDTAWTSTRIKEAMHSEKEQFVKLKEKRPVSIGYFTAWVDLEGNLNFRDDVYGHDVRLANELFSVAPAPL
jgi:L,D-transpeptidase YcbB